MKNILHKISNILIMLENQVSDIGLIRGKMGISIFLYHSSRIINSKIYQDTADSILDVILENKNSHIDLSFTNGLGGIGYGLNRLIKNQFVDANPKELFIDIDNKKFAGIENNTYASNDDIYLFSQGLYVLDRIDYLDTDIILKSIFIKCTSFCKQIYNEKFQVDKKTLIYLNSILYFLISLHGRGYYCKTIEQVIGNILIRLIDSINEKIIFINDMLITIDLISFANICPLLSSEFVDKASKIETNTNQSKKRGIDVELILQKLLFLDSKVDIDIKDVDNWLEDRLDTILDQDVNILCYELSIVGLSLIRNDKLMHNRIT